MKFKCEPAWQENSRKFRYRYQYSIVVALSHDSSNKLVPTNIINRNIQTYKKNRTLNWKLIGLIISVKNYRFTNYTASCSTYGHYSVFNRLRRDQASWTTLWIRERCCSNGMFENFAVNEWQNFKIGKVFFLLCTVNNKKMTKATQ